MATEKCLDEILGKYMCSIDCEELSCPDDKILCIVNYIQYSEEATEMNSFPETLYDRFYYLLGTICESTRDMVLQQCVYQLIFMLNLQEDREDELVTILFGKDKEHLLDGECLFN
jgi:hypothetical protein